MRLVFRKSLTTILVVMLIGFISGCDIDNALGSNPSDNYLTLGLTANADADVLPYKTSYSVQWMDKSGDFIYIPRSAHFTKEDLEDGKTFYLR